MGGAVLAAALPIVADLRDHLYAEVPLLLIFVLLAQEGIIHLGPAGDGLDQLDLFWAQRFEDGFDVRSFQARLKVVQQRVVNVIIGCKALGVAAAQLEDPFQRGPEAGKIVVGASLLPNLVGVRGNLGELYHQLGGNFGGFFVGAPGHFDQAGVIRVGVHLGGRGGQVSKQLAKLIGSTPFVGQAAKDGHLVAACFNAAWRHIALHIPVQNGSGAVQVGYLAGDLF